MSKETESLYLRAANAIDTTWHYSWGWEKNDLGQLTMHGKEQALADCEARIEHVMDSLQALRAVRGDLRTAIEIDKEQA